MRILITGAGGNLGGKLRRFLKARHELVLLSRHARGDADICVADLSVWNEAWVCLFEQVDVVVHLAAIANPHASWATLVSPNVDMVLNIYGACLEKRVRRVVFASSNHVMSGYRGSDLPLFRSDTPPCPGNPYGASKLFGEHIGKSFSERHDISSINVRIGWNLRGLDNRATPESGEWERAVWLSDRDYCQLMDCCINASASLKWAVINGTSTNTGTPWDLTEARDLVGYVPKDNAFAF